MRRGMGKKSERKALLCSSREPRSKLNFQNHLYLHQNLKKNQELPLLEQDTQPQTEKKQELRAF